MGQENQECDVLIIGAGGAGLRALIAVAETHPDLKIGIVSKVYPMRSHTVSAEGGAASVNKDNDSLDHHAYDTISGSDWMCDQDAVELFVKEAPGEMIRLEHWGCPWSRQEDGKIAVRSFGGMKNKRTWYAADKTGFHMLHTLYQTSLKYENVLRYDEWFVTKLLVDEERCQGAVALDIATGNTLAIKARSTVICTGGAGKVFPFTTNGNIKTGDGMSLAYRAGVPLKDMEFVQYHPTGLPLTGILITEAARAEGGWLVNKDGYRYLQDYNLGKPEAKPKLRSMELGPRDRLSQAFVKEQEKERTLQGPYGDYVHLDIRHLGEKLINSNLPFVREVCRKYVNVDPVKEMIPVRPVVHYMMGGIHTDINGATPMPGLYAAGECACVSINGANRLGSNSLTECLVFGSRAGSAAGHFAMEQDSFSSGLDAIYQEEKNRLEHQYYYNDQGTEKLADIRTALHNTTESGAGIFRTEESLLASQKEIQNLQKRFKKVRLTDNTKTFNTEIIAALELGSMLDVAESLVQSALQRKESRGSHQRIDHPDRDDENYLGHSLAYQKADDFPEIKYQPVTITRWPPAERVYGQ